MFKAAHQIFEPDPRYRDLCVVQSGAVQRLTIEAHHAAIASIDIAGGAPHEVRVAFDLARNILLYAWFDYELLVIAESQAFSAFELALRRRLHAGKDRPLSNLIESARKLDLFPSSTTSAEAGVDPIDALRHMRNALAHGSSDVHSPAMAFDVVKACSSVIDMVFPPDIDALD